MGNTLDTPIDTKETFVGTIHQHRHQHHDKNRQQKNQDNSGNGDFVKYSVSSMQGWRPTMEDSYLIDAHLFYPPLEEKLKKKKKLSQLPEKQERLMDKNQQQNELPGQGGGPDEKKEEEEKEEEEHHHHFRMSHHFHAPKFHLSRPHPHFKYGHLPHPHFPPLHLPHPHLSHHQSDISSSASSSSHTNSVAKSLLPHAPIPGHAIFAVFDGHGGSDAALYASHYFSTILCHTKEFKNYVSKFVNMNDVIPDEEDCEEIRGGKKKKKKKRYKSTKHHTNSYSGNISSSGQSFLQKQDQNDDEEEDEEVNLLKKALYQAFIQCDAQFLIHILRWNKCESKRPTGQPKEADVQKSTEHYSSVRAELKDMEEHFTKEDAGTTAVVVLLTPRYILCANVGDARAILCTTPRDSSSSSVSSSVDSDVPPSATKKAKAKTTTNDDDINITIKQMSIDHKPEDPEEMSRILEADGSIISCRVDGELAVSRAIGDYKFKHRPCVLACAPKMSLSSSLIPKDEEKEGFEAITEEGDHGAKGKSEEGKNEEQSAKMEKPDEKMTEKEIIELLKFWNISPVSESTRKLASKQSSISSFDEEEAKYYYNHYKSNPQSSSMKSSTKEDIKKVKRPEEQKVCAVPYISSYKRHVENDVCIVLACDGIWDVVNNAVCWEIIRELWVDEGEDDLGLINEELLDICLKRGSQDNMTAMIVQFPAFQKIFPHTISSSNHSGHRGSNTGGGGGGGVLRRRKKRLMEKMEKEMKKG